ncbi:hypothetical protein LIPSTDRAFT_309385 [Lipomyces starkeyi NRRL Y-11557]|uniref:Uncharacterized protein n=1 Tax=Lipomyces starkeyi NRRL Y-11557 TaxID=675824 RepID=A0A1E3Q543_LIPST|nr:hypothetical protein LIPSTDRAFT_309385 [Lipomyces starkeyi NRRL Y-11557]
MPHFGDDHHHDFSISSGSSYHNSARQVSLLLKREALDRGVDVESTRPPQSRHQKRHRSLSTLIMPGYLLLLFPSSLNITRLKGRCAGRPTAESRRPFTVFACVSRETRVPRKRMS